MKRYAVFLLLPFIVAPLACKKKDQPRTESVDFDKSFSISSQFDDVTSEFNITIHLGESLHVYAPGEKIGKPVKLEITDLNGWQRDGQVVAPPGKPKDLGNLGTSIVLEGDVRLSQKLKKGRGKGEALLHLQVCSTTACDRPRVHRLPLESGKP